MKAVKFWVRGDIYVENRDPEGRFKDERPTWTITWRGNCFNRDGEWEYEPMPSARDDAFFKRCRFTFEEILMLEQTLEVEA